jgi:hypothetical protein
LAISDSPNTDVKPNVAKATDKTKVLKSFQRIIAPPYCPGWKLLGHIFASFGKLLQMNDSPETNKNPLEK